MSTAKHTAGPWSHTPLQDTIWANDGQTKVARVEELPWVETPSGKHSSDWMTEQANAQLIAAAPDLLAACKAAECAFVGLRPNDPFFTAWQTLRAAITKAEGKA